MAFLTYDDPKFAQSAIKNLNNTKVGQTFIKVVQYKVKLKKIEVENPLSINSQRDFPELVQSNIPSPKLEHGPNWASIVKQRPDEIQDRITQAVRYFTMAAQLMR